MDKNKFYVYILLNFCKKGRYSYGEYTFGYEPFYVGKGKGKRFLHHVTQKRVIGENKHKTSIIKKIIQNTGSSDIPKKIIYCSSEAEAFELERFLIKIIGWHDLGKGPLTNHTDGGEGQSGVVM